MGEFIKVREVSLRDGLQLVKNFVPTNYKLEWLKAQLAAGFCEVEVTSFVPASVIPQFSDAKKVLSEALKLSQLRADVLVPNVKGAELALENGARNICFVISASEAHNFANVNCSTARSLEMLKEIVKKVHLYDDYHKVNICGVIATAFGCSIQGKVEKRRVFEIVDKMLALGLAEIIIADTVGFGTPYEVKKIMKKVVEICDSTPVGCHFHDTRGTGIANVVSAVDVGVRKFDSSIQGLGGCPFAPGASGNIATEDCVHLLERLGFSTGIDFEKLIEICKSIAKWVPGEKLNGKLAFVNTTQGFS